jgi:hypothetical protein
VLYWLEKRGVPASDELVDRIFAAAKQGERVMTEEEVQTIVRAMATPAKTR